MKKEILKLLKKIEKEEKVKILFAIESGSRAWKWESEDSDYDVRGVFVQDYLKFTDIKNQVDRSVGDLDVSLWDLKKFFKLIVKSNPSTWEWLSSDIVYTDNPARKKLAKIFENNFNKYALKKHYASMARQNFEKYIKSRKKANLKKYVYVLRSIACVLWIEKYRTPPPKSYKKVIKMLPKEIRDFFEKVVKDKKESEDLTGKRNKKADEFISSCIKKDFKKEEGSFDLDELNKLFKSIAR